MKCLKAQQAQYKIIKCVGVGLTSQVYEALRVDDQGYTQQKVALKIIRSRNDVSILRKEFQRLVHLDSNFCVKLLAWENLKWGPALVLEYVDGCTLDQLAKSGPLPSEILREIYVQVASGLKHLHAHGFFHGDLNLKNIMMDRNGSVKLIDFGFQGNREDEYCLTPEYASPERLSGKPPSVDSDFYSLGKIVEKLIKLNPAASVDLKKLKEEVSHPRIKKQLGLLVSHRTRVTAQSTRILGKALQLKKKNWVSKALAVGLMIVFMVYAPPKKNNKNSKVDIRGAQWFQASLNGMPFEYGPYKKTLRPGQYKIVLKSSKGESLKLVRLEPGQTLRLNLD